MKLLPLKGSIPFSVNFSKYKINWDYSRSKVQQKVQNFLKPYWKFDTVLAEYRVPRSLLRLDIFNCTKGIIVEVSPEDHHGKYNEFFHKNRANYKRSIDRDMQKIDWAKRNNLQLIELNYSDVDNLSREYVKTKFGIDL